MDTETDKTEEQFARIAALCKKTGKPVFLAEKGEVTLVVMDLAAYNRMIKTLDRCQQFLAEQEKLEAEKSIAHADEIT